MERDDQTTPGAEPNVSNLPPGAVRQPHGGWLRSYEPGSATGGNVGVKFTRPGTTRKAVRRALTDVVANNIPQLESWISGRAKVLVGFKDHSELAERFHELYERKLDPDADKVPAWADLPESRRELLISVMRELTGGKLTIRQIALNIGHIGQQTAMEMALRYGLGVQSSNVDEEGNAVPGVVLMPTEALHLASQRHRARLLTSGVIDEVPEGEFEYVVEEIDADRMDVQPGEADVLPPVAEEERVNPALVAAIRSRRKLNGNGNGNGH